MLFCVIFVPFSTNGILSGGAQHLVSALSIDQDDPAVWRPFGFMYVLPFTAAVVPALCLLSLKHAVVAALNQRIPNPGLALVLSTAVLGQVHEDI